MVGKCEVSVEETVGEDGEVKMGGDRECVYRTREVSGGLLGKEEMRGWGGGGKAIGGALQWGKMRYYVDLLLTPSTFMLFLSPLPFPPSSPSPFLSNRQKKECIIFFLSLLLVMTIDHLTAPKLV